MRNSIACFIVIALFAMSVLIVGCGGDDDPNIITPPTPSVPTITSVIPDKVSRGQKDFVISVRGTNFNGATLVTLGGGILVHGFRVVSATQIDVDATVIPGAVPGSRPVAVTTPAGTGLSDSSLAIINNSAPVPSFTLDPPPGSISNKVNISFDASGTKDANGGPLQFRWDFGDGSTGSGQKISHQFTRVGSYSVSLTVQDNAQSSNTTVLELEIFANAAPVAAIQVSPGSGDENDEFQFDGSSSFDPDGRVVQYVWNFHDGKPNATGKVVVRTFEAGTYEVTLTVTDNKGTSSFTSKPHKVDELKEVECTVPVGNRGLFYGTVIAVEPGRNAIVQLDNRGAKCSNSFYKCGDMRDGEADLEFFGIIKSMHDRGNGIFRVENDCPFRWPPRVGQRVFLFHKNCEINFCP